MEILTRSFGRHIRCEWTDTPIGVIANLVFDSQGQSFNAMTPDWFVEFADAVQAIEDQAHGLRGVTMTSAKATFLAGGDLRAVLRDMVGHGRRLTEALQGLKTAMRRLEQLHLPVVACLCGSALGGGWEVALLGHTRLAVDDARIRFGLPELGIGMFPSGGGTVKTIRLLGVEPAVDHILGSRTYKPAEALELGLVHALVPSADRLWPEALAAIERTPAGAARHPWDDDPLAFRPQWGAQALATLLAQWQQRLWTQGKGRYPSPARLLQLIEQTRHADFDTAMAEESRCMGDLLDDPVLVGLLHARFLDALDLRAELGRTWPAAARRVHAVAMQGAGKLFEGLRALHGKRRIDTLPADSPADAAHPLPRLSVDAHGVCVQSPPTTPSVAAGGVRVRLRADTLQRAASEVVLDPGAADADIGTACAWLMALDKSPICVTTAAGGLLDRVTLAVGLEALALWAEGFSVHEVARQAWLCDWEPGPLLLLAQIGREPAEQLLAHFSASDHLPAWHGHPGLDVWDAFWSHGAAHWAQVHQPLPQPDHQQQIGLQDRLLLRAAVEVAHALAEKVLSSATQANVASLRALGYPAWTGGAVQHLRGLGRAGLDARTSAWTRPVAARFAMTDPAWTAVLAHDTAGDTT